MFKLILKISIRNVFANWKQSLSALISIISGFIAIVIFSGYISEIFEFYYELDSKLGMKGHLIIEKEGASSVLGRADVWEYSLNSQDQKTIFDFLNHNNDIIEAKARFLRISGSIDTNESSNIYRGLAYDPNEGAAIRTKKWEKNTYFGRPLSKTDEESEVMVIGLRLAQKLNCLPDPMPLLDDYFIQLEQSSVDRPLNCREQNFQVLGMTEKSQVNALDINAIGSYDLGYKEYDERFISLPLSVAQKLFDTDKISYIVVTLKSKELIAQFNKQLNEYFKNNLSHVLSQKWEDHPLGEFYTNTKSLLTVFRNFVMLIVLFVVGMSVFNTFIKLIKERTKEVGMFRSLGFNPKFIRKLYVCEALVLALLGCVIGIVISYIFSSAINFSSITYDSGLFSFKKPLRINTEFFIYIQTIAIIVLIATTAAFVAIRKPSKENIIKLLLHS